jgi:hypothetical protein
MLDIFYTYIALCFLFILSTIWSEDNVRYGYVLVPLLAAFFWWVGFLNYPYLGVIIPLILVMGVIAHLRAIGKFKMGIFGSNSGMLVKIVVFLIFLQMSIGFINGIGMFSNAAIVNQSNDYTGYTLQKADTVYSGQTTNLNIGDAITNGWNMIWVAWTVVWGMLSAVFLIYPTLVDGFHIPATISALLQCGIYILYGTTVFNLIFKPYQPVEM